LKEITIPPSDLSGTIDVRTVEEFNSPVGLSISLKMKRPRFPFTDRIWSPGNKVYLVQDGYTAEATHYFTDSETRIAVYESSFTAKILSSMHGYIGAGFYHKWLFRNFWNVMWKIIAKSSGLPEFQAHKNPKPFTYPKTSTLDPDVLVVGGGLSGLTADSKASEKGAKVVIVDDHRTLGGFYRYYLPSFQDKISRLL
jgi:hypothetical protein